MHSINPKASTNTINKGIANKSTKDIKWSLKTLNIKKAEKERK